MSKSKKQKSTQEVKVYHQWSEPVWFMGLRTRALQYGDALNEVLQIRFCTECGVVQTDKNLSYRCLANIRVMVKE